MERKLLTLGRAKKKLRYFQPEEKAQSSIRIKEVFSLCDLDDIFDDLDSDSGTPQCSPVLKSSVLVDQTRKRKSPASKLTSPFGAQDPEVLALENCVQDVHVNYKGSPFKEIAPIKTSSPIELIQVENEAMDTERPETSPILFGVEDEPVQGGVSKTSTKKSEFCQDESVVSPAVWLECGKPASEDVCLTSCMPLMSPTAASKGCQTSAPETKEESQMDGDSGLLPLNLVVQNDSPKSRPEEQPTIQSSGVTDGKSDVEVKQSLFQQKLKNAFTSKVILKPEVQPKQARAPSPIELEDDFMILEDDTPILFTIPKKTEARKARPLPEDILEKSDSEKNAFPVEPEPPKLEGDTNEGKDESDFGKTKKAKATRGKTLKKREKAITARVTPKENTVCLPDVVEVWEPSPVPEASQEEDLPGKQTSKGKTSKSDHLDKKDRKDDQVKWRVEKPASKIKKPAIMADDTSNRQEEPAKKAKKKSSKTKSTVKVCGSKSEDLHFPNPVEETSTYATLLNKQIPEELEQVNNLSNNPEPPLESSEIPNVQRSTAGKQTIKSKTSKSDHLGKKERKDAQVKQTVEKPASKMKKPVNVTDYTNKQQKPAKKDPSKTKSTVKVGGSKNEDIHLPNPVMETIENASLSNKELPEELEHESNNPEAPLEFNEQADVQSATAVKKASKQAATKPGTLKRPVKVKKLLKAKGDAKIKELPVPECDVPGEDRETNKRKRKPPGEWWLTNENPNNNMQLQEVSVQQSLQELRSSKKIKRNEAPAKSLQISNPIGRQESQSETDKSLNIQKLVTKDKKSDPVCDQKKNKTAGGRRKKTLTAPAQRKFQEKALPLAVEESAATENVHPAACSPPTRRNSLTSGEKRVFEKIYTRESHCGSAQKCPPSVLNQPGSVPGKRQRKPTSNWWEVPYSQGSVESSKSPLNQSPQKTQQQMAPTCSAFDSGTNVNRSQKTTVVNAQKKRKENLAQTPRTVKRSLAAFDAISASGKPCSLPLENQQSRQKGRRNLLHSLKDQSEQSTENISSDQQHGSSQAFFDVCTSGVTEEHFAANKRTSARLSAESNRRSAYDTAFKSGPSSLIELERFEDQEDADLPKYKMIPCMPNLPRVLSDCDFCGPPLLPIVLESEDWDNLRVWFAHLWPSLSDGQECSIISPDDFHWHSHGGRAMGHMVDFQNNSFSNGKILLGSYMKKPLLADLHAVTVFNVVSSSVRVEIDGAMTVCNSGQVFMVPCGQSYTIHNVCREPAVLWYTRMLQNNTNKQKVSDIM